MGRMENLTCLLAGRLESLVLHGGRGLETEALGVRGVVRRGGLGRRGRTM